MLLWELVLFHYVYPANHDFVPREVWDDLLARLRADLDSPAEQPGFRGSLIDERMFAIDVQEWGMENLLEDRREQREPKITPSAAPMKPIMRIAALADLHFTPQIYDKIREQLNRVRDEADVLVLAGDLTNFGRPAEMESLMNALVRLRIPIVAVLGNHDYESGHATELMKMMTGPGHQGPRRHRLRTRWRWLRRDQGISSAASDAARSPPSASPR